VKTNFCVIYISFVFKIFVVVFGYGCYLCPLFLNKKFILGKGWSFWGFISEPPQGMLCLVIGLFRVRSKKIMEETNIC